MLIQYYALKALVREFDSALRGFTITELYSQQKNELVIGLSSRSVTQGTEKERSLCISVSPGFNYIVLRQALTRAKKNSVSLFEQLSNLQIEQIAIHPCDRTLIISTSGDMRIVIRLYNTAESNIFLIDNTDRVISSFKRGKELSGTQFVFPERRFDERFLEDEELFTQALNKYAGIDLSRALKDLLPQFGPVYVKELIRRAESGERGAVSRELKAMIKELDDPMPIVYIDKNGAAQLSLTKLKTMEHLEFKEFRTVNEAVEQMLAGRFRARRGEMEKHTLFKKVGAEIGKIEKSLAGIKNQKLLDPKAIEYMGQLILSNLDRIKKGMKSVELPDLHKPGDTVSIPLEPALSPSQNADKYFQKARKTIKELEETEIRFKQLTSKLATLKDMEKSVLDPDASSDVKGIIEAHKDAQRLLNLDQKGKEKVSLPFRVFPLEHGYEVWVGKSSTSNDLLTMKHAAPHDLWFHVRGASGSHTVLKVRKGENVPREIVYKAAGIAAYYSKMRNASNVPVAYCERKYVRKPKGVKSGTVTMEREKVIFVKPGLPIIGTE